MMLGHLACLTENRLYALAFLFTHAAIGMACVLLAVCTGWALRRTRQARIALLSGFADGRRAAIADLFSILWLFVALIAFCGLDKLALLAATFGAPYIFKVVSNVLLSGVALATTWRAWRLCRILYRSLRPTR